MMRNQSWEEETDAVRLAQRGVPPELCCAIEDEEALAPLAGPLLLTTAELEVMLCFTLTSPLNYGSIEESLCEKLRRHLRKLYVFRTAAAPQT